MKKQTEIVPHNHFHSLRGLLELLDKRYDELETENPEVDSSLQTTLAEVIRTKIDALAFVLKRKKKAIEADKQLVRDLKKDIEIEERKVEHIKSYVRDECWKNGFTTDHRLAGESAAFWYYEQNAVKELAPETVPKKYQKYTFSLGGHEFEVVRKLMEEYNITYSKPIIEYSKSMIHEDIEKGLLNKEDYINVNRHLYIGKT